MARLPIPGQDNGTWGNILNDYLDVEFNADGTLKRAAQIDAAAIDTAVVHKAASEIITGSKTFNAGALLDKGNHVFDVKAYGATGNGSTDDASAIQAAINAASSTGGVVFFPQGTYSIASGLTVTSSNVSFVGVGAGASTLRAAAGHEDIPMLLIGDSISTIAHIRVSDLLFDSVNQKTSNAAIKVQLGFKIWLDRLRFENQYRAIHIFNTTETWFSNSDIRNTKENGFVYEADLNSGYDCYLNNIAADNPTISNNGIGLNWRGGENMVVHNCDFIHFAVGFQADPPVGAQSRWGFFTSAEFDTSSDNNIHLSVAGGDVVGLTFVNCWSGTATNYGVLLDGGTGSMAGIRFVGSKVVHNGIAGFRVTTGTDISIANCDVVGNSQTSPNSRSGIEITPGVGSGWSITGCRVTNGWSQGNTQSNGINLDAGTYNNFLIANNVLSGNTNNGLSLNGATGTGHVTSNIGYNPVGNISAPSVPASTVAYANNTGLDCTVIVTGGTVTAIAIGGTDTGLTSGTVRIPHNQTITLTYSSAPTWAWFAD